MRVGTARVVRRTWLGAACIGLALLGGAVGCSGDLSAVTGTSAAGAGTTGTGATGTGTTTPSASSTFDAALLGRWRRVVLFTATDGTSNSSETTWTFAGDGSALRTVVSRNISYGLADAVNAAASWRTEGSTVVITYRPPDRGTVRFAYAVERSAFGDALRLNSQSFVRVGV